jgi:hypothetical protein
MKITVAKRPTFDDVLDWFLAYQRSTNDSVCEVIVSKRFYNAVLKVSKPHMVEDTLYGAALTKGSSTAEEVEVVGC